MHEKNEKNTLKNAIFLFDPLDKARRIWYSKQAQTITMRKTEEYCLMSTFMAKPESIQRKWFIIDAEGKTLGKVAVLAATILNGKHTPAYTPHVDCGDCVVVINTAKVVLTGRKLDQKIYYRHSGYIGGLKQVKYRTLMETRPEKAIKYRHQGPCSRRTRSATQASPDSRSTPAPSTSSRRRSRRPSK